MKNLARIRSPRGVLPGVVIAAGLVLVYTFNAGWQDHQSGLQEQELLDALNAEFVSVLAVLKGHLTHHVRTLKSLENLLNIIDSHASEDTAAIVDAALLEMTDRDTWDRDESTLNSLLSDGRAKTLSSAALKAQLEAWDIVIDEYWGDQEIANKIVDEVHMPYFANMNISIPATMSASGDSPSAPQRSASNSAGTYTQMLEDPKFQVLAETRYRFKEHLIVEIERAIAAAEAIAAETEKPVN